MTASLTAADLQPSLAGRYAIERELGRGGMATVFLARDLKHDRDVAIKVLDPQLARSIANERFLREIGIAARLNHPHILPLLDSGVAGADELPFYVMPLVTGESLRDRLQRDGRLPLDESLRLATEVTDALAYAHEHRVVHRDVKPDNVMLSGAHAVVMDFGIAKAVGEARQDATLTGEGISLGTPAYMAPEQAAGEHTVDQRADVYAVGALLFEMLSGSPAFAGSWQQIVREKMAKDPPSLASRWPDAPAPVVRLVARCLARDPAARPATAESLLHELRALATPPPSARSRSRLVAASVVALAAIGVATGLYLRQRRIVWVHETAIPTIGRLIEADQLDSAFALASEAERQAPGDSVLGTLWTLIAQPQRFLSEPSGAQVERASLDDTAHWIPVGTTPTSEVRIPRNAWYYRYTKPGYRAVTIMGARLGGSYVPIPSPVALRKVSDPDTDMVLLRGKRIVGTLYGLPERDTFDLADFLMDAREVTNRQYKAFVAAGGYADRALWDSTIVRDGKPVAWEDAQRLFVDRTGQPGPSSWVGGAPSDADDLPVGGVSWYEARAYARFVHKELPTVFEWNAAAIPEAARWVVPHGRYDATGPVRGGDRRTVSPRGVYDMAGNVREWTVNAREPGSRYILGGGWSDPAYLFSEIYTQPEMDRSPINGIRLVRRLGPSADLARASAPVPGLTHDYSKAKPVDDATFRAFLTLYDYDHTPLNAKVVARDSGAADWVREEVEFDVPGDSLRMRALLFLPRRVAPPYQTVVIFPASDVQFLRDYHAPSISTVDYLVRGGRAVLYPIYEHTYGRGSASEDTPDGSIAHRDQMIRWAREMRRSIDYASTRPDVDTTRLAYSGTSWGGRMGGVLLALEPRFRVAVLNVPGLSMLPSRPEEDPVNFLPRIHIPVLMLSGRYDSGFPLELSQKPFFRLLGSPPSMKRHVLDEGGHFLARPMMVRETLAWLDRYLGPVQRR